jgi:hypothetical protein
VPILTELRHAPLSFIVFLIGMYIVVVLAKHFSITRKRALFLYCWHAGFSIVYLVYSLSNPADASAYYNLSLVNSYAFSGVSDFVYWLTKLFSVRLGLDYLGVFLVYNIVGSIGLISFFASLKQASVGRRMWVRRLSLLVVLLPSVSFWSAAIGKDAIAFMAAGLSLWAALNMGGRLKLMAFAVFAMFLVRPHVAGMMIIALLIASFFDPALTRRRKVFLFGITTGVAISLIPFAIRYAGLSSLDIEAILAYINLRQSYNQAGGGGIDISSMGLPLQLFTYLFRPLPYEASTLFQLASSMDNLVLLFICAAGGLGLLKGRRPLVSANWVFLWVFVVGCWLMLAVTTANLGISVRQKWMFAPMLVFLLVSITGRVKDSSTSQIVPR